MMQSSPSFESEIDIDEWIERLNSAPSETAAPAPPPAATPAVSLIPPVTSSSVVKNVEDPTDSASGSLSANVKDVEAGGSSDNLKPGETVIEWSDVKCTYPAKGKQEASTTLFNASGNLKTRELTAIMGHSGSGKSTLLDILSGLKTTGNVTGTINIFGKKVTDMKQASRLLRNVTSFVPQDVAFFPMQTPEEAVQFVAKLMHTDPNEYSLDMCHKYLKDVGLKNPELYTRPIGGDLAGGLSVRGLSGGEQKRLALACALAMSPQLIMLDEITSGLDSENALATIQLVKEVCRTRNVAAAIVIHQPDGYIFQEFDRLVLLARGACIFSNHVSCLDQLYRDQFGVLIPTSPHEVPLDMMRRLGKIDPTTYTPTKSIAIEELSASTKETMATYQKERDQVPFSTKLWVVLGRNATNHYFRNLTNLAARLFAYTACSLMDGCIFWGVGRNSSPYIVGALAFVILASYLLPFCTMPVFVHEKKFFVMERSLGLYTPWIYCISQAVLEMVVILLASVLETSVVVPMVGLWNPTQSKVASFFTMLPAMIASGLAGSSLILLSAIAMPSQDIAFLFSASMVTFWLGMSGGFVPLTALEDWISWLQWFSPCKYSMNAFAIAVLEGTEMEPILEQVGLNKPDTIGANIGILFTFYLVFAIGTMFALSQQSSRR